MIMVVLWIILGVVLLLFLWGIGVYNRLIALRNTCDEGFSTMDVYMKKRFDLIPNLVETVKGYASHEKETLERVIAARQVGLAANTPEDKMASSNMLSGALRQIFALSESYPELKANLNFQDLQNQLLAVENDIANSRKYYNAVVKDYNTQIQVVPANIVANMTGFTKRTMFEVDSTEERQAVKVSF